MSVSRKFLFETSFEPDDMCGPGGDKPAKPKFDEEDLEKARAEGFAAGQKAGERAARQAVEQQAAQALNAISARLADVSQAQARASERQTREVARAALTVVRKLFPRLVERHGLGEIEAVVSDCLERLREEPRIVIRVADSLLDEVETRVSALAARAGFDGRIVFLSQEDLQPGDVRVEWADGGAERDSDQLWREIDQVIAHVLGPIELATQGAESAAQSSQASQPASEPVPSDRLAEGAVVNA
ncbi:MAG: hypothetical protein GWO12_14810 [Gemmatimonadetes bacterium]|uniref:Flagellar assembly protein FliH n=1 Tax=Candidatus Kutchimonas denitrificans TaxID=3056748 RepID=A0AAE4ZDH1_9BACT|nr:hypothetical protein [Candidatus Kutchimonas denitrificans]